MSEGKSSGSCNLDDICINTIRTLSMDAVQKADSGHPGAPMGLAPAGYVLWTKVLKHNPKNPLWPDRDRFVLSGGHASMLLYSLLHLTGYDLTLDDLKNFRQWESKTPGHPEYGHTPGVETTTGPLGQGFANAVGMAMAERFLASRFNRPDFDVIDHHTFAMCGDGDLMEGLCSEAASLAGHLALGKLIVIYDDNKISIEGSTDIAFTEDVEMRFKAYNWQVLKIKDGNDIEAIFEALKNAKAETGRPSMIMLRTQIAYGSPNKQGTADAHGSPLGVDEVCLTKRNLGCAGDQEFCVGNDALNVFRNCIQKGNEAENLWKDLYRSYSEKYPELAKEWSDFAAGKLPDGWDSDIPDFTQSGPVATRSASGQVLNAIAGKVLNLRGGSADLAPSNKTIISASYDFQKNRPDGRNIRFGVREHAMGAILSGMALHKGIRPYGGTFLVFADYMRPSIRLAALMKLPIIYVFTHDSIAVGEDGPTHQPVEHLASLRIIPNLLVIRPADATETAEGWRQAILSKDRPVALILSRQKLEVITRGDNAYPSASNLAKGAYILSDSNEKPDIILMASGSEVQLAVKARERLTEKGVKVRVVSMPCWELFNDMPEEYREKVLPKGITARIAVEAGVPMGWERYVGTGGAVIGIDHFGASAPGGILMEKFGFTVENIVSKAMKILNR
ncbi:MAG: transketolase [Desulfobacterales bacterium]|nr:transketolase [Desulfobacterales bacterium]